MFVPPPEKSPTTVEPSREEEEEEEEEEDDEGLVEEQLNQDEPENTGSNPSSPPTKPPNTLDTQAVPSNQPSTEQESAQEPERKRRPGRPRGSKNRKVRAGQTSSKPDGPAFYYQGHTTARPPQHPDVTAQNQQYYEFQWRVLNLCAEFYGAAEELVKGTSPTVVAQCYHMGPTSKVDPLYMLGEAKRICDTLLANPSQLVVNPPPLYNPPVMQSLMQPQAAPIAATSTSTAPSTSKPASAAALITNPQSFVVPLGAQPPYASPFPVYPPPPPGQYATTPYYHPQYPYSTSYYTTTQVPPISSTSTPSHAAATTSSIVSTPTTTISTTTGAIGGNQGPWSDEEVERLKKLAEESKSIGTTGEVEWDWVVHQWGNGRSRHQILLRATSLGLKESTSRGVKRRRETEGPSEIAANSPAVVAPANATAIASPAQSATPTASPALQSIQQPPSKGPTTTSSTPSTAPWPMPTVAGSTPAVIAASSTGQDPQRTSYYRPRPNQTTDTPTKPASQANSHHYVYTPNGHASRSGKEPGK